MPDGALERQLAWERSGVDRGVSRYRASLSVVHHDGSMEAKPLSELEPGQRIMRDVMDPFVPAVESAVAEAREKVAAATRRWEHWWFPILSLVPDVSAFITLRCALTAPATVKGKSARSVALEIGRHMRTQREYELWKEREQAADRGRKKAAERGTNWHRLMVKLAPEVDERAFRKFAAKSELMDKLDWPREVRLAIGMKMLGLLVENGGGWFEMLLDRRVNGRGYSTETVIRLTSAARQWIASRHAGNEFNRPWLLPMLCQPKDWTRGTEHEVH